MGLGRRRYSLVESEVEDSALLSVGCGKRDSGERFEVAVFFEEDLRLGAVSQIVVHR